jgi:hypothetical protein
MVVMEKPIISLFATAARPKSWRDLYESISTENNTPFEIVFVGPNKPDYTLPDNFFYIKSDVKPTQCVEIAARNTSGILIIQIADDLEFTTPKALDKLWEQYKNFNNDYIMLSPRYVVNGIDVSEESTHFFYNDIKSPILAVGMILTKKLYTELGGMDKNFIAIHGESDIAMRLYSIGGKVVLSDICIEEDKGKSEGSELCEEFWKRDRKTFEDLWVVDGKAQFNRLKPFEPFSDYKILTESQGPRGRWI